MKPNALAWLALYGWPIVVLMVFALRRSSHRLSRTTAWMMILPVLFLPAKIGPPFAGLNKHRIACLSVAAALAVFHWRDLNARDRSRHLPTALLTAFGLGSLATVHQNSEPLSFGILRIPGLGLRDGAWIAWEYLVDLFIPFAIGQRVFRTERDLRDLLEVLSTCALIYLPLCLIELRLSPQLSNWIYGYFPHSFAQAIRGSGFRPVVFMNHGLSVAMFMFSGLCATLALRRVHTSVQPSPMARGILIGAVLLLCKSLASILYGAVALALHLLRSARASARMALVLATVATCYPGLRALDLVPTSQIGEAFKDLSAERSASLMFRFVQEGKLVEKALQRPWFGWGNWGRGRLYTSWGERGDPWAGYRDTSITDGAWIIWLGTSGFFGFALSMALFAVPLFRYVRNRVRVPISAQAPLGALALMVGLFTIDLIPNALSDSLPVFYAGAVFTLSATLAHTRRPSDRPAAGSSVKA